MRYLVYDIETCVDKKLLNKVVYPGEGLTDEEAFQEQLAELAKDNRDFINPAFHQPITLAAVAVKDDFSIQKIGLFGGESRTPRAIVQNFWEVYQNKLPTLVDFNGKGFDVRVLELWAFRLGITIGRDHYSKFGARYKFAEDKHLDLNDFLNNFGAIRLKGGLNLFSKILGKPGKTSTKGDMVQELYEKGEQFRIDDYCLGDAMDTYFVFLRTRVMTGDLTLEREQHLVEEAKEKITAMRDTQNYFHDYLKHFGEWSPEF